MFELDPVSWLYALVDFVVNMYTILCTVCAKNGVYTLQKINASTTIELIRIQCCELRELTVWPSGPLHSLL